MSGAWGVFICEGRRFATTRYPQKPLVNVALTVALSFVCVAESLGTPSQLFRSHARNGCESSMYAQKPIPAAGIHIAWIDKDGLLPSGFTILEREVCEIFGQVGVEVTFTIGPFVVHDENVANLQAVLLPKPRGSPKIDEATLGTVTLRPFERIGPPIGCVFIFVENILRTLRIRLPHRDLGLPRNMKELTEQKEARQRVSVALGRVLSHECVHAVAPEMPHSRYGLMHSVMYRTFLTQPKVVMSSSTACQFLSHFEATLSRQKSIEADAGPKSEK